MYNVVNMPDLVIRFFSSNIWLVLFIISSIYLFFRINGAGKRAFMAAMIAFLLIINSYVIKIFTSLGENQTFYRHLWAIPSVVIIGIAIVDIIRILPRWFLKISAIAVFAVLFWFVNQEEYIRCRIQIFSTRATMVQDDVILLGDGFEKLREKSGKNTLFIVCPAGYSIPYGNMRSELSLYSGNLEINDASLLYNEGHDGEAELSGDSPDVPFIMSTCCANGMDYVIVAKRDGSERTFSEHGYNVVLSSNSFSVYSCTGYDGFTQDKTNWGKISWIQFYDEKGNNRTNHYGYSLIKYQYDERGNKSRESYYDTKGDPIERSDQRYASKAYAYDGKRKVIGEQYYGTTGEKKLTKMGYATVSRVLNKAENIVEEKYYNAEDELIGDIKDGEKITQKNLMRFLRCSDGTCIEKDGSILFISNNEKNSFNAVYFYLYDAWTKKYLTSFGAGNSIGEVSGVYHHEGVSGLYYLRYKANGTLSNDGMNDGWIESLVYLEEGETLNYMYTIDKMAKNEIVISNMVVEDKR